jgi:hypothetical protein
MSSVRRGNRRVQQTAAGRRARLGVRMLPLQEQKAAEKHAGGKAKRSKKVSEGQAPALEEQVPNDSDDDEVQESDEVEQGMAEVDNVADQDEDSEDERDEEMMGNEEIGANERLLFKEVQRLQRELDEANAETSRAQQARANAEMRLNEAKKTIKTKKKVQFAPQTPAPAPTSGPTASFPVESLADLMRQMTAANEAKEKRDNKSKGLKNFAFAWLAGIDKAKVDVTTRAFVALLELASTADHSCVGLSPDLIIQALGQNKVMHRDDAMWQALSPELMAKSSTEPLHDEFSVAEFLRGALAAKIQTARESASGLLSAKSLAQILPDLATLLRLAATPSVAVGRLRHAGTLLGFAGENEIASFSQFLRSKTVRSALEQGARRSVFGPLRDGATHAHPVRHRHRRRASGGRTRRDRVQAVDGRAEGGGGHAGVEAQARYGFGGGGDGSGAERARAVQA